MEDIKNLKVIGLPIRGEWEVLNTPAHKIPSHGTDALGQRYAFDFVQLDCNKKLFQKSKLQYMLTGVPTSSCYCWKKEIYAPEKGEVIDVKDGLKEPRIIQPLFDYLRMLDKVIRVNLLALFFKHVELHKFIGNYIIIKHEDYYSFYAHLYKNSILVKPGQQVKEGDLLGKVGHSGNSTAPHLHFQLMDSPDLLTAKGIPCAFQEYELAKQEEWITVHEGIPNINERFRTR